MFARQSIPKGLKNKLKKSSDTLVRNETRIMCVIGTRKFSTAKGIHRDKFGLH